MKKIDVNEIITKLSSLTEEEKLYAIDDLKNIEDGALFNLLTDCLKKETSQIVRDSILFTLKKNLSNNNYHQTFELFHSDDAYIRNAAVSVFSKGGESVISFLEGRFHDSNKEVKKLILDVLFEIGTPGAGTLIRNAIMDEAPNVRITAIEYVGRLGLEVCQEEVISVLEKEDEPMLILSILMSLQFFQNFKYTSNIKYKLCPEGNLCGISELYLGEYIKVIAKFAEKNEILKLIEDLQQVIIDSQEVIELLIIAVNRFRELFDEASIQELLVVCLQNPPREEKVLYKLFQIMNKSNDPTAKKITEEFTGNPEADINAYCSELIQAMKINKD